MDMVPDLKQKVSNKKPGLPVAQPGSLNSGPSDKLATLKRFARYPVIAIMFVFSMLFNFFAGVVRWFKVSEPRWKTTIALLVLSAVVSMAFFFQSPLSLGATYTWTQTNWNSSTSNTTGHPAAADWTEYSAKDSATTAGSTITSSISVSSSIKGSARLANIFCLTQSTCWIADGLKGDTTATAAVIKKTTDSGATWTFQEVPTIAAAVSGYTVSSVHFSDANNGYATIFTIGVGVAKPVIKTTDGGTTWALTSGSLSPSDLAVDIYTIDANTAVLATKNEIYRTANGGTSWTNVSGTCNTTDLDVNRVSFLNSTTGYVAGENGLICISTDAGATWTAQTTGILEDLNDVYFVDATTGYAVGDVGTIIKTTDGGTNWVAQTDSGASDNFVVKCASATVCWVGGRTTATDQLTKTTDGGTNWAVVSTPENEIHINSIAVFDSNTLYIGLGRNNNSTISSGRVMKSINGGTTWTALYTPASNYSVAYAADNTLYSIGTTGTGVYKTTDDAVSWSEVTTSITTSGQLEFISATTGWYLNVGNNIVSKTTNGGTTWVQEGDLPGSGASRGHIYDSTFGLFAREGSNDAFRMNNGTWTNTPVGANGNQDVFSASATVGYIAKNSGEIWKTTDSGVNWTQQTTPTNQHLQGLYCISATTCWAVGDLGTIITTSNGGTNWTAQTSETSQQLHDAYFINSTDGFAVGANNTIIYTTTGGSSWSAYTPQVWANNLGDFVRIHGQGNSMYIQGEYGYLLKLRYGYVSPVSLTSSAYNSSDAANVMGQLSWTEDSSLPSNTTVTVSVRTASTSGGLTSSSWSDFTNATTDCSKSSSTVTCTAAAIPAGLKDGTDDQWFQYKVTLVSSTGVSTATVSDVTVQYVVNAPPEFNDDYPSSAAGGVSASQVTDTEDANFGKVAISYSIRDTDTSTGTSTPGFITPTFHYNIGGGWVAINAANMEATDDENKAVDDTDFTTYTAYWDAASQIPNNHLTTAQVRVTINDNEGANNTALQSSANFTLDTTDPTISSFKLDASAGTLTLVANDDENLSYKISNDLDMTADGLNATSGEWQDAGGDSISLTPAWNFALVPNHFTVYVQVRDAYGNVSSATVVSPNTPDPDKMFIKDITNLEAETYAEFVSWEVYSATAGSAFQKYEVYRSDDGSSYNLIATITEVSTNYYADFGLTADVEYFYKVRTTDTDTDKSNYSIVVSDAPNGQGGTDAAPPLISSVAVGTVNSTSATITWTTDELSDSRVDYSISPSTLFGTGQAVSSFVLSHSITLTNLTPGTVYLFRVRSIDALGNTGTEDNDGAGFTFTTSEGPVISGVTESSIGENTATIFWTTDIDSDSHVTYSTNSDLTSPIGVVGTNTLVGGTAPFEHSVNLTALSGGTTYYYKVSSTDADSNTSTETNGGSYYSFVTTTDNSAPVITNVGTPVIAPTAVVIVWETNEPATSQVLWGTTAGALSDETVQDDTLSILHAVSITGLEEGTEYFFQVKSIDEADNETTSDESSFTTGETTVVVSGGGGGGGSSADTTKPTITGIQLTTVSSFEAEISFSTNEDTIGLVEFGKDSTYGASAASAGFAKDHVIKLRGLIMGTDYNYRVKAIDKGGNIAEETNAVFKTKFFTESTITIEDAEGFQAQVEEAIEAALPSLVPPFIDRAEISDITEDSATVKWRTNIKAFSIVAYSEESQFDAASPDPYQAEFSNTTTKVTQHEMKLVNLKPNTRYHVLPKSFSIAGSVGKGRDQTFVTRALKIQGRVTDVTNRSFVASWNTPEPTSSIVQYRNLRTNETNQRTDENATTVHNMLIENLEPATSYEVRIFGFNANGNQIEAGGPITITTSQDTAAPEITNLKIDTALIPGRNDRTQTIIGWKTNEPSNSVVYYEEGASGATDKELANKVEITDSFVADHAVVLTTLKPGSIYRIQVASEDLAGNRTVFPVRTIVIPRQTESIIDVIFKNFEDTFNFLR